MTYWFFAASITSLGDTHYSNPQVHLAQAVSRKNSSHSSATISCVVFGKSLGLSEPQIPPPQIRGHHANSVYIKMV